MSFDVHHSSTFSERRKPLVRGKPKRNGKTDAFLKETTYQLPTYTSHWFPLVFFFHGMFTSD